MGAIEPHTCTSQHAPSPGKQRIYPFLAVRALGQLSTLDAQELVTHSASPCSASQQYPAPRAPPFALSPDARKLALRGNSAPTLIVLRLHIYSGFSHICITKHSQHVFTSRTRADKKIIAATEIVTRGVRIVWRASGLAKLSAGQHSCGKRTLCALKLLAWRATTMSASGQRSFEKRRRGNSPKARHAHP
jgi:hypothetical protein